MVVPLVMLLGFTDTEPAKEERCVLVVGNRSVCQREMGERDHGGQGRNLFWGPLWIFGDKEQWKRIAT